MYTLYMLRTEYTYEIQEKIIKQEKKSSLKSHLPIHMSHLKVNHS